MKILCLTDFSKTSVNAIDWIINFIKANPDSNYTLHLVHSVNQGNRFNAFVPLNDFLIERAQADMAFLEDYLKDQISNIKLSSSILNGDIRIYIKENIKPLDYNLVVIGSKGLNNLKNLTVGSVAEYASQHVKLPLFIIPDGAKFENHKKIILALDHAPIKDSEALYQFHNIIKRSKPEVLLTQVVTEEKDFAIDLKITKYLKGLNFIKNTIISSEEVNEALNSFVDQSSVDYISLIHEDKNWLEQFLHNSVLKKELFNLTFPLLIIPK